MWWVIWGLIVALVVYATMKIDGTWKRTDAEFKARVLKKVNRQ